MIVLFAAVCLTACGVKKQGQSGNAAVKVSLSGAGATFPQPFYVAAFQKFQETSGNQISYGGIGSGGGIRSLQDGTVDFAGSDAFLKDEDMQKMKPVIHIPTCAGAVVPVYNLKGVKDLKLTGEIIAEIYMGKITKWNDPKIASINPEIKLPNEKIIPVYRSDGSGTTNVFTDYLTKVSPEWASKLGAGKTVAFPTGVAAKGNPGVAGVVINTANAIGYVGSEYAFAEHVDFASVQNANGEFIRPDIKSVSLAASGEIPADTRLMITNSQVPGAYPIACLTWIIVYQEQNYSNRSEDAARGTLALLKFMMSDDAQKIAPQVNYAPLPEKIRQLALKQLDKLTYNGKKLM